MPAKNLKKNNDWYTPKEVVSYFGEFDYDPATTKGQAEYLGISNFDTIETDGLNKDWTKYKRIWINPPFTNKEGFLKKARETFKQTGAEIYVLLPVEFLTTQKFHDNCGGGYDLLPVRANQV